MKKTVLVIAPLLCAVGAGTSTIAAAATVTSPAASYSTSRPVTGAQVSNDARPIEDLQLAAQRLRDTGRRS